MAIKPKWKILYAVTNDDNWEVVQLTLEFRGFEVQRARTVAEVAEAAANGCFDLFLLSNSFLEDGTGRDACARIRSIDQNTPIVFYSALAHPKDIATALAAGGNDYITLPDIDWLLPDRVTALINLAQVRSLEARVEEERATAAALKEMCAVLKRQASDLAFRVSQAQRKCLKAQASFAFVKAGGTPANFERMWPEILQRLIAA